MSRRTNFFKSIDWWMVAIYLILVVCGWICIYGASYNFEDSMFFDFNYRYGKQLLWIGMALLIGGFILLLDCEMYSVFAYGIYAIFIVLLLVTLVVAPDIKGSRSWLVLGPVSLQPAEFAKTATCLALARLMSSYGFQLNRLKDALWVALVILLPTAIIILQNETGSALVYLALSIVLYREGMPGIFLFVGFVAVVFFIVAIKFGTESVIPDCPTESYGIFLVLLLALIVHLPLLTIYQGDSTYCRYMFITGVVTFGVGLILHLGFGLPVPFTYLAYGLMAVCIIFLIYRGMHAWRISYVWVAGFLLMSAVYANTADYVFDRILQPHQQTRIEVTLGMLNDPKKSGYNVNQSKIAIGSGGFLGKGFLNGTQTKLKYVPEQDTDFIFCTVGEEHGFVGCLVVMGLYLVLLLRLIYRAEKQKLTFNRIYGYCVAAIIFFHLAINVGMVSGLTPVIGIPLPFFSYGGSSLWGFTILLFIFIRIDAGTKEYGLSGRDS